jgi:hypothetical protein
MVICKDNVRLNGLVSENKVHVLQRYVQAHSDYQHSLTSLAAVLHMMKEIYSPLPISY